METTITSKGLVADMAVHTGKAKDGGENPHVHILFTTRPTSSEGFETKKLRELDSKETLVSFRKSWEVLANETLKEYGYAERIDHRSHKDRNLHERPTNHLGKHAHALENKGLQTDIGNENREIEQYNRLVQYHDIVEPEAVPTDMEQEEIEIELEKPDKDQKTDGSEPSYSETENSVEKERPHSLSIYERVSEYAKQAREWFVSNSLSLLSRVRNLIIEPPPKDRVLLHG